MKKVPFDECALLSRSNARRYVGGIGEETFDREVAPHAAARLIGKRRFYRRKDLDAWIEGPHMLGDDLAERIRKRYRLRRASKDGKGQNLLLSPQDGSTA